MNRKLTSVLALAASATLLPGAAALAGGDGEIEKPGNCTGSSDSELKVKPDDGRIEVEFEVDQNQTGDKWKVKVKDNGDLAFKTTATTRGPSGSFSVERKIDDLAGADRIKATARNKDTDERCSASATL
jgi:hypothetical protein